MGYYKTHGEHEEEQDCPKGGKRELQNDLRVRDEHQTWAALDDICDAGALRECYVTENRKRNAASENAGKCVYYTSYDSIPLKKKTWD